MTLTVLISVAAAFVGVSCTAPAQQRIPTVSIAIRPVGDRPPSVEEIRQTLDALGPALLRAGAAVAERSDLADYLMTVTFTPAIESSGSRVTVNGLEPTPRLRDSVQGGETPEMRDWRRRMGQLGIGDTSSPPGTSSAPP
jgi:hypothetical protein